MTSSLERAPHQPGDIPVPTGVWSRSCDLPDGMISPSLPEQLSPYSPTPMDNTDGRFREDYRQYSDFLRELIDRGAPLDVPQAIIDMANSDFDAGLTHRSDRNTRSLQDWMARTNGEDIESVDGWRSLTERLLDGDASPEDVLVFMQSTSLNSAEVARLVTPWGMRLEHLPDLYRATIHAIVACHGVVSDAHERSMPRTDIRPYFVRDIRDAIGRVSTEQMLLQTRVQHGIDGWHRETASDRLIGLWVVTKRPFGAVKARDGGAIDITERRVSIFHIDRNADEMPDSILPLIERYRSYDEPYEEGLALLHDYVVDRLDTPRNMPMSVTVYAHRRLVGNS